MKHDKDTAATIVETSPQIESMDETYINALITMKLESMQDLQKTNTTTMDSMLATKYQMTYDHRTHNTQIEQLAETTKEQARHIDKLNKSIVDQNRQLTTLNSEMRSFDGWKQKFEDNITLIEPLSTSISAIQTSLDHCESQVKCFQNLRINNRLKALEQPIDDIHKQRTRLILKSSISGHLDTLVTCTNLQMDKINTLAIE